MNKNLVKKMILNNVPIRINQPNNTIQINQPNNINQFNHNIKLLSEPEIDDIINNSNIIKQIKENNNKIYLISFGNQKFYGGLERIKIQGNKFKIFDEIIIVTDQNLKKDEEYKEFWNKHKDFIENNSRGYGYWIWKSHIIQNLINKINDDDIVVYVDAGCNLNVNGINRMLEYLEMVKNSEYGIFAFQMNHLPEKTWTKMDLFKYFDCINEKILNSGQMVGGINITRKCKHSIELINKWTETVCDYHLVSNEPSIIPNDPTFNENRHDQSIFSLLIKTMGGTCIPDETYTIPFLYSSINLPIWATRHSSNHLMI
jgi:hypothetical protein